MTITMLGRELEPLRTSGLSTADLENLAEDITGRTVADRMGEEIGTVEDVLVSRQLLRAPFVIVRWSGLLGIGRQERLVPAEAIDRVEPEAVYLAIDHDVVTAGPSYSDALVGEDAELHYEDVYRHYGVTPYWERAPLI